MENQKASHLYNIYLLIFFIVLTLPLLSFPPLFHPPDFAKTSVMRGLFPFILCIFIYQIIFKKNLSRFQEIGKSIFDRKSGIFLIFWAIVLYLGIYFLATIFSVDVRMSLWDSPMRGGGFVISLFLFLFSFLVLFTLKPKDWQKIWDYSIAVGAVVSIIAILQKFNLFSKYLAGYADRPVSTMGGPIFLSLYLILLSFLTISFLIAKNGKFKKSFYFICLILFFIAISVAATRAAFLGLGIGFLFFVFFFPSKSKKIAVIKVILILLMALGVIGFFWLRTQPKAVQAISGNKIIGNVFYRIWGSVEDLSPQKIFASRAPGWIVGSRGLKDRPILGYGPENFSIIYDKYYDPAVPGISISDPSQGITTWWDRAHNFALEIALTQGIPALLVYLSIFIIAFWKLRKIKKNNPDFSVISHGIQATFISYLTADFFGFDVFSTYLILFLVLAYAMFIIHECGDKNQFSDPGNKNTENRQYSNEEPLWKYFVLFFSFIIAVVFCWNYSVKPLIINRDINVIEYWQITGKCEMASQASEKLLDKWKSILDSHLRLVYINTQIGDCGQEIFKKDGAVAYYKAKQRLEELMKIRPYYTRTWLFHMIFVYNIISKDKSISSSQKDELMNEALTSFKKAYELSPKRQPVFIAGAKTYFSMGKTDEAKRLLDECFKADETYPNCYWTKANINLASGELEEGTETIKYALEKGYYDSNDSELNNFINYYSQLSDKATGKKKIEYYNLLVMLYKNLISIPAPFGKTPDFQPHASLAFIYKELGQYSKAREEADIVLKLSPESKQVVEEFLKTLPR